MSGMSNRIFERKAYEKLKEWKRRSDGKTALLVEGARRVGKTTLVKEFGKNEYSSYIFIDFFKATNEIKALFDDLTDLDRIFRELQFIFKVKLIKRKSLIIFDEVQLFPRARESIKAFVEDGRYDYIETGSLVSIKKNVKNILIPSEEERIKLHPLDFEEFLWANNNGTYHMLFEEYKKRQKLNELVHKQIMKEYMEYLAVGGMPMVVSKFIDGESYQEIDNEKRKIIQLYLDDFRKIDPSGKLGKRFLSIPSELSRQTTRYRLTNSDGNKRLKRERELFFNLEDSQTVTVCKHVNDPKIGFNLSLDEDYFKLFLEDTGLFVTLCFYEKDFYENEIYKKLISGKLSANLGYVFENAVAQTLTSMGFNLYYHTFKKEDNVHYYEIDFLTTVGEKIRPIEVKSSNSSKHKSLDVFLSKKGLKIDVPVVVTTKNISYENGILYLPIYMLQFIDEKSYTLEKNNIDSYRYNFEDDDWIEIDGKFYLYIKKRNHKTKNPHSEIYKKEKENMKIVDLKIDVDEQNNIKIISKNKFSGFVSISSKKDN